MALILAWLITAGGVVALIWSGVAYIKHEGYVEGKKAQEPIIAKEKERADKAESSNLTLQRDLGVVKSACDTSERAVNAFRSQQAAAVKAAKEALARLGTMEARVTGRLEALDAIVQTPTKGNDCAATDTVLRDGARERVRDNATGAAK